MTKNTRRRVRDVVQFTDFFVGGRLEEVLEDVLHDFGLLPTNAFMSISSETLKLLVHCAFADWTPGHQEWVDEAVNVLRQRVDVVGYHGIRASGSYSDSGAGGAEPVARLRLFVDIGH